MSNAESAAYWERRLSAAFHLGGVGYLALGRPYNEWIYRVRKHVVARAIRQHLGPKRDCAVIDIGSGTGFYLELWRQLGFGRLTGSDLTAASVAALSRQYPDMTIEQIDIGSKSIPFDPESFDVATIMDVFPHITSPEGYHLAVANCAQLLKANGLLFFSDYLAPHEHRSETEIVRTRHDVASALDDAGLEVLSVTPMFVLMNNPICAPRVFSKLWRLMLSPTQLHPSFGWVIGAVLYPIERMLTRFLTTGPSAKLIVCRRRPEMSDHAV